jgi:transposase-like protein
VGIQGMGYYPKKVKNDSGIYQNRALHFAIGINLEGRKELLGMWLENNEGAKFWLSVVTELLKHCFFTNVSFN